MIAACMMADTIQLHRSRRRPDGIDRSKGSVIRGSTVMGDVA